MSPCDRISSDGPITTHIAKENTNPGVPSQPGHASGGRVLDHLEEGQEVLAAAAVHSDDVEDVRDHDALGNHLPHMKSCCTNYFTQCLDVRTWIYRYLLCDC